jgi:molybdopterin synthase sulfur carrier subunit
MKIKLKYFASFRDMTGKQEESMDVEEGVTVKELRDQVREKYPKIGEREMILVAVNGVFTSLDKEISEGDEVALFPPVSGG